MSKAAKFCLVYYYVPEDKDDPEMPNAFGVNIAIEDVKIPDIRRLFPLDGEYIFRFKSKIGSSNVWLDVKEDAKIPLFNGKIVAKATRVSWESRGDRPRQSEEEKAGSSNSSKTGSYNDVSPKPTAPQQQHQTNYNFGAEDLNLFGGNSNVQSPPVGINTSGGASFNKPSTTHHDHHDLLDFGHSHGQSTSTNNNTQPSNASKKHDLLSFDNLF
jgi:hypothetical protein